MQKLPTINYQNFYSKNIILAPLVFIYIRPCNIRFITPSTINLFLFKRRILICERSSSIKQIKKSWKMHISFSNFIMMKNILIHYSFRSAIAPFVEQSEALQRNRKAKSMLMKIWFPSCSNYFTRTFSVSMLYDADFHYARALEAPERAFNGL